MKKLILLIVCLHSCAAAFSQDESWNDKRTSLQIGLTYQGMGVNKLNNFLQKAGYPALEDGMTCISLSRDVEYDNPVGYYSGLDFGLNNDEVTEDRSVKFSYYRIKAGLSFTPVKKEHWLLSTRLGFTYSVLTMRLYDAKIDSNDMKLYVQGNADMKRMQLGQWGMDAGVRLRLKPGKSGFTQAIGAGCVIPLSGENWRHDAIDFDSNPKAALGTWYVQALVGIERHHKLQKQEDDFLNWSR